MTHLGLLVDHEGPTAHDVTAVTHLSLAGADFLGVLDLYQVGKQQAQKTASGLASPTRFSLARSSS